MDPAPRISGRTGSQIDLNLTFFKNGVPTDPFAIRRISIYKSAVTHENLIAQIPVVNPCDIVYTDICEPGSGEHCDHDHESYPPEHHEHEHHEHQPFVPPEPFRRHYQYEWLKWFYSHHGHHEGSDHHDHEHGSGGFMIGNVNTYPWPLAREEDKARHILPGVFHMIWDVPCAGIATPDIFFDVWEYVNACPFKESETYSCEELQQILNDEEMWQKSCNEFWLYPDGTSTDNGLETLRLGFEALDVHMYQPEKRTLEIGIMPLPLYDFNYNLVAPIIPRLKAIFTLQTESNEILIKDDLMRIGLRQGTYRSSPFVLQYTLDSTRVLKGTYKYRATLFMPNGETRVTPDFYLQVS